MDFSLLFPTNPVVYLNSGTFSKTPRSVLEAMRDELWAFEANPTRGLFDQYPRLWEIQKSLAAFFGAEGEDLFFRENVTAAFNLFFFSYPWPQSGEILVSDCEYGAILNLVKVAAAQRGLTVREFKLPPVAEANEETLFASVVGEFRPETRGLLLSHVLTGNGLVLPIQKIAKETRARNIIFAVDGAHAAGALPLNFAQLSDIDFYGSNLHKWMMGPKGTGFGWMPERIREKLEFNYGSWASFTAPPYYRNYGDRDQRVANLLPPGCFAPTPYFALEALLAFWQKYGVEKIREQIFLRQQLVEAEVDRVLGWKKVSPGFGPLRGPLLAYAMPEPFKSRGDYLIHDMPQDIGVQVNIPVYLGQFVMRFAPHIYVREDEIIGAIQRISNYVPRRSGAS